MDRKIKRYLVYVVCMAVLLAAIPLQPVKAESTEPSISLNESTVTAGSYFYSYLSAKDFQNISALKLTIRYDADAFEYNSKYAYSLLDGSLTDINASTPGEIHISIMNSDGITGTGNLFRLQFQAKSSTSAGNYSLKISVDEACDTELNSISIGKSNGTVTVKEVAQTVQTISFSGSCSPSKAAYEDSVIYTISNWSGSDLAGGTFTVQYDADKLTFDEVTKGKLLDKANALYDVNDNGKGTLRITFMADQNIYASYGPDLLNIHFTVKENSNATTTITMTPSNLTKTSLESLKAASFETSLQLEEKKEEEPVTDEMSLVLSEEVSDGVFTIDTILHSEKGMAAGDFIIQYDKNAVKCKNVTKDDSVSDTGSYLVTKEKIDDGEVAFSLVNTKGLTGEYTLLHLEFELIDPNAESTIISINGQDIVGVDGDAIRVKFNSATVEVPTPEPTPTVSPSEAPTASPSVTPEPTVTPTSSPEVIGPTVKPSEAPTVTPTSTPKPSPNADKVWFETSNMEENGKISAKLYVNSTHGLAAADFYLTYDKQYLLCKKAEISSEAGKNAQITLNPNIEDGFVRFSYINLSGLNTKCCLVELEFEVISDQKTTTTLTSSIQDAVDTEFNDLTFICNNIDVKINETAQEPSKPTPTPVTSMQPSATPIPTASAIPTVKPSTAPTSSPVVSAEPSESPTASAQPTTSPGNVTPTGTPSDVVNPGESLVPGQTPENNSSYDSEWGTNKSVKINKPVIKKAVNKKRRKLQITLKKMSQISGFQCYYSTKKNFKKKKRITSKKYKFTLKKLSKKRYYIKVRAFRIEQNGVKRFGKWSKIKKVKVKK